MDAEVMVNDLVDPIDLRKYERLYLGQKNRGAVDEKTQFDYGLCLIRSKYINDMKKGVQLLNDLLQKSRDDNSKKDYLYFLAVGNTKLKDYEQALQYVKAVKELQPQNHQAISLEKYIKSKMTKEGLMGMAIIGGAAAVALGGMVGLGMALSKK